MPTDAPCVKFRPRETIFFFFTRADVLEESTRREIGMQKETGPWPEEMKSVEEIGEKKFYIDIWVLHGKLDTGCVYIFWNHLDREVSVADTSSILIEGMSINEVGHWEVSAFFITNKFSVL